MNVPPGRTPVAPADISTEEELVEWITLKLSDVKRIKLENARDQFIDILKRNIEIEDQTPGREKLRDRIQHVEKIAGELLAEIIGDWPSIPRINDPPVFPLEKYLLNDGENWLPHLHELYAGLNFLTVRCGEKLSEMPRNKGRTKHPPDGARFLCALMAAAIFEFVYKERPGHTSKRAHDLCAELWQDANGPTTGQYSDNHSGWRNHLKSALAAQDGRQAKFVRKTLGLKDQISGGAKKSPKK